MSGFDLVMTGSLGLTVEAESYEEAESIARDWVALGCNRSTVPQVRWAEQIGDLAMRRRTLADVEQRSSSADPDLKPEA